MSDENYEVFENDERDCDGRKDCCDNCGETMEYCGSSDLGTHILQQYCCEHCGYSTSVYYKNED